MNYESLKRYPSFEIDYILEALKEHRTAEAEAIEKAGRKK